MPSQVGAMTSHPFETGQFDPFRTHLYDFKDYTLDGGPDRSLHPGIGFGPYLFCFNTTPSKLIGDVTFTIVTFPILNWSANCPAHGLNNGDQVRLDTDGLLPIGLFLATYYFVVNKTTDTFQLAATSGGAVINVTDPGVGHINVTKRGHPLDMTGWSVAANGQTVSPAQTVSLAPTIVTPTTLGTVQIVLLGSATVSLLGGEGNWDMTAKDNIGTKLGPLVAGEFDIVQLVTPPPA